jgi:hypothetical protein
LDPDSAYTNLLSPLLTTSLSTNAQVGLAFVILLLLIFTALIAGSEVAYNAPVALLEEAPDPHTRQQNEVPKVPKEKQGLQSHKVKSLCGLSTLQTL